MFCQKKKANMTKLSYKLKCHKLKRRVKNLVIENAAIRDEITNLQGALIFARDERRFLIRRIISKESADRTNHQVESDVLETQQSSDVSRKTKAISNEEASMKLDKIVNSWPNGKPHFPINLQNLLIHSAGEILPVNPNFHTNHWIYPVGYIATRKYAHPKDPQRKCVFTCKILNNSGLPQFQIIPDNDLDSVFFGDTANACHQRLLEALQLSLARSVQLPLTVQGEVFFGLGNPIVQLLLKRDNGFKYCANFRGFLSQRNTPQYTEDEDPTVSYEALQSLIGVLTYHSLPEVKEEPPDELFNLT